MALVCGHGDFFRAGRLANGEALRGPVVIIGQADRPHGFRGQVVERDAMVADIHGRKG